MSNTQSDTFDSSGDRDDAEKLDDAFREMEMLYRSRCVDVPLSTNVKVVEIEESGDSETSNTP